jgi:hypothetical protein
LYGAVFVTLQSVLTKIGTEITALEGWTTWLVSFTVVLPALIGIGLGRDPSGFLSNAFIPWRLLFGRLKRLLFAGIALALLAWFLAFEHTISNWTFALATAAIVLALPRVAALVDHRAHADMVARDATPIELIGIDRDFTSDDLLAINRGIGLEGVS